MLRFIKHHLETEIGVAIYGMLSLLIFTLFFTIVLIRIYRMKQETINELSNYPLGLEDSPLQNEEQ